MKGREKKSLFMWRVDEEDLPKLISFKKEKNESHWVTTKTILNEIENLKLENAEIQETNTRLKKRLEGASNDVMVLARHLFALGFDDINEWGLSEKSRNLINLDYKIFVNESGREGVSNP